MPDNHDVVFDWHDHHDDHVHRTTGYSHIHDRHPYHHHNRSGSVVYLDNLNYVAPPDNPNVDLPAVLIGESGFDITHRTRPA